MKKTILFTLLLQGLLFGQELKIKANSFSADESKGVSIFNGNVNVIKENDELNASNVTIYTDKDNSPTKFVATGNVSFKIQTKKRAKYRGKANRVIYFPKKKEYQFFENVHLKQIDDKKEIQGDKVILNTLSGKAYAKGLDKTPVIMIFDIQDKEE